MSNVEDVAREIAIRAHAGQVDKAGEPYIGHVGRVAAGVNAGDEQAVAWLHDFIEDTDVSESDLLAAGIPAALVEAVVAITHLPDEPRADYYARVRANALARAVKLSDVADNSDPDRLAALGPATADRLTRKYEQARVALA
jgi:(p)ppGpp synthase/HD superfamily hydrolase